MRIIVTGGTGFLGRPLCDALAEDSHAVFVLTRSLAPGVQAHMAGSGSPGVTRAGWVPDGSTIGAWASLVDGADAVINLSGESIGARRWSPAQKARIRESRILATRSIVTAIRAAARPPKVLLTGSAVGYYGNRGEERLTESSPPGGDFLSQVCIEWEREASAAAQAGTRVVPVRTGLVLERDGGALKKMLPPFRLFAGGPLGSGRQYMSWIHRTDWVEMVRWAMSAEVNGALNAAAPEPVTNAKFSKELGRALGRPSWLPAPAFALKAALGEMGEALLLGGQRVIPARATALGFSFRYPTIDQAFRGIFAELR